MLTEIITPIGKLRPLDSIAFTYHNKKRFGQIHRINISHNGNIIITCWIDKEKMYKAFRLDGMRNIKKVKIGWFASLFMR
jgi:hypothetical protein